MPLSKFEKKRFLHSLVFPIFVLLVIWGIKIIESILGVSFASYGIYPQSLKGLPGILFSPLIHGDFEHLIANSIPLLTLSIGIFYFYNKISYKIFFLIYLMTGLWVWIGAREAYHIGASGLVYGFASFLFVSGVIRNDIRLLSISLIVVFLYGSMIWGILPLDVKVSWESHLLGSIAGLALAFIYRKEGPQKIKYEWEDFDDDEYSNTTCSYKGTNINYRYFDDPNSENSDEELE